MATNFSALTRGSVACKVGIEIVLNVSAYSKANPKFALRCSRDLFVAAFLLASLLDALAHGQRIR